MIARSSYLSGIWSARYFWVHLALSDIRIKYRRSLLGLAWALVQPLALTILLSFVMGNIFQAKSEQYAPYIFSGLIVWEFITSSAITGCTALTNAEGYIKQFTHPMAIYTLRSVLPCLINLGCASLGLFVWSLIVNPVNLNASWLCLPISFVLIFFFAWPLATIAAFIGVQFRDFSQLIIIGLQAVYYISPIFFLPDMFLKAKIGFVLMYNPIYHLLNLFRMPLLYGQIPFLFSYMYVCSVCLLLWLIAWIFIKKNENKVIFYL